MVDLSPLRVLHIDPRGALARWQERVLLQCRVGELEPRLFATADGFLTHARARGVPAPFLVVVEPGAPIPSAAVRDAQRSVLDRWTKYENARMAVVVLGDDTTSSLARSAGRLLAANERNIARFDAVRPAISWLARELAHLANGLELPDHRVHASDLAAAVDALREKLAAHRGEGPP